MRVMPSADDAPRWGAHARGRARGPREHLVIAVAALVAGCAVGPDFFRPSSPAVKGYTAEPLPAQTASTHGPGGEAQRFAADMDIPGRWWELFRSPALNSLIAQALAHNPTLEAAQAALRQARENVYAQQGAFYPGVQAGFSFSRQQNAIGTLAPTLISGSPLFSLYTPQVSVSYVPDVFGANRRQVESLQALSESQRYLLEATYLTLTSNVVVAAIQEASLRAQIAATEQVVQIESEQLDILRRQNALGAIAQADVVAQETALAQTQASIMPLRRQLALQRDLLAALAGRFPDDEPVERFELSDLELPRTLPLRLPSMLVEQRPNIRVAEAQLHAASAQVGVATANLLPQITLTADAGSTATMLSGLFTHGTGFWSLAAGLTQPIFEGGTLLHRKRAAEAALDQAAAQYRSTVIAAFQNVADTLRALQYDAEAVKAQAAAESAAADSLDISRRQLQLGAISYLALLNAEQAYQQSVINLVQARASRLADTAALFQALGGGWWNRGDADAAGTRTTGYDHH